MSKLVFQTFSGRHMETVFPALATLRIAVFRHFPYLYEGNIDYERTYLETYFNAPDALLFAVFDGATMVGATTCIPLRDETTEVKAPFLQAGFDLNQIFYFGESVLLPAYRGHGLGHRFFDVREAHARSFAECTTTCFCAVQRPIDHALRPADYQPLDAFWQKRGYRREPALQSTFEWPDVGETVATSKQMVYWTKALY